jgi:CRISPR-associated protein Csx17
MNRHFLLGCSPTPLAHYLKALGVLRLLSEQLPPDLPRPRAAWHGETFVLHTSIDRPALERFFLFDYRPTGIVAPWNGGSGFFEGDKQDGIAALSSSTASRFQDYREAIAAGRNALARLKVTEKPEREVKDSLLRVCRSYFPNRALEWVDAALVLTGEGPRFPPLLGTGGNDGRLEFTNNFMQRLMELFTPAGEPWPGTAPLLIGSLFGETTRGLAESAIGQFFPHAAGGANSTSGFDAKPLINPWDFVLMLEGALLFGAAAVKRLESTGLGELAYPFSVRPSGFGYASNSAADAEARCELWAPLWEQPASLVELRQVLGEGRARLLDRVARDGFEFTRAVASLGVDRGLTAFQRYSFAPRNGRAYFATPLDRVPVRRRAQATALLDDLDRNGWLDRIRGAARADDVPSSVTSAVRQLEQAALALLRSSQHDTEERDAVESLLIRMAEMEATLAWSLRWTQDKHLSPVPTLSAAWWEPLRHGAEAELDLAAGLASLREPSLRVHWEPLDVDKPFLAWNANSREVVWHDAQMEETLLAIHERRLSLDETRPAFRSHYSVQPASIAQFLDGQTDDARLARLARALSLVELAGDADQNRISDATESFTEACAKLPALFLLPRLALAGHVPYSTDEMPRLGAILRRGAGGDGAAATALAAQRLRASGFAPAVRVVPVRGKAARRAVAATLFPLSPRALEALADQLRPLTLTVFA